MTGLPFAHYSEGEILMKNNFIGLLFALVSCAAWAECKEKTVSTGHVKVTSSFDKKLNYFLVKVLDGKEPVCVFGYEPKEAKQASSKAEALQLTLENAKRNKKNLKFCADGNVQATSEPVEAKRPTFQKGQAIESPVPINFIKDLSTPEH